MQHLPWYSFLYRLLGAQGTFFLWLLVGVLLWWTGRPALVHVANRSPSSLSIEVAANPGPLTRWVELEGLRIEFDRRLLLREEPTLSPISILVVAADPAARWWTHTRLLCQLRKGSAAAGQLGGILGSATLFSHRQLLKRFAQLEDDPSSFLPGPGTSLLLQDPSAGSLIAPPADSQPSSTQHLDGFLQRLEERVERVLRHVQPTQRIGGVLDAAPRVILDRIEEELELRPVPYLLRTHAEPGKLEFYLFLGALLTLLFLGVGLYGATRAPAKN